jgi:RND family efflux transporter MFP subunit
MKFLNTLLVVGLASSIAACSQPPAEPEERARAARIETVLPAESSDIREFVGRVEARLSVDLAFQVGGRLADFPVSEGQQITEGDRVAALETQDFERALREAGVGLQQARQTLERQQTLHDRGIASDAALEDAQTNYDLRAVAVDNARQNLAYATIEAPFDGLVARRVVDNYTTVAGGQPVVRLQDVSELRLAIQVPERTLALINPDMIVEITARFPFLPDQSFELEFRELVSEPDQASQTYTALFALPNDIPANILPGMTASVRIITEEGAEDIAQGVRAPVSALVAQSDGSFIVWVYDPLEGRVHSRLVGLGPVSGDTVMIETGLNAGEQIVTAGVTSVFEGMAIRPLQTGSRDTAGIR